jgi:hypothetical protein
MGPVPGGARAAARRRSIAGIRVGRRGATARRLAVGRPPDAGGAENQRAGTRAQHGVRAQGPRGPRARQPVGRQHLQNGARGRHVRHHPPCRGAGTAHPGRDLAECDDRRGALAPGTHGGLGAWQAGVMLDVFGAYSDWTVMATLRPANVPDESVFHGCGQLSVADTASRSNRDRALEEADDIAEGTEGLGVELKQRSHDRASSAWAPCPVATLRFVGSEHCFPPCAG